MTDNSFADDLARLLSHEMRAAKNDRERMSGVIERMAHGLAFSIAIMCRGDAKAIGTTMAGIETYLHETAADLAPLASLTSLPSRPGGPA